MQRACKWTWCASWARRSRYLRTFTPCQRLASETIVISAARQRHLQVIGQRKTANGFQVSSRKTSMRSIVTAPGSIEDTGIVADRALNAETSAAGSWSRPGPVQANCTRACSTSHRVPASARATSSHLMAWRTSVSNREPLARRRDARLRQNIDTGLIRNGPQTTNGGSQPG